MKLPNEQFCILPWISLETSPIGTVRPCCLAEDELRDNSGAKFDLSNADFTSIQSSRDMQLLRRQFLAGEQPKTCRKCWREERAGRTSKRMHTLERLKHIVPDQEWTEDAKPLLFLDLKLGNICNLKCRICGSWSSSTFATEELHYVQDKKASTHYQMLKRGAWPRDNATFWQEIDQVVDQVRYIEFTGGEPFMIEEHFALLQRLVHRGAAAQIEIHYNTNGTIFPEQARDIWRHFKLVEIAFSIDDVKERFEYQRANADWNTVQANIHKFQQLKQLYPNIQLQVCSTVNVYNILYLNDLANWIDQQCFDFVYWNIMHEAYYFSISTLPDTAKQAIAKQLQQQDFGTHSKEIDNIIEFMLNGASLDGNILRMRIADLDRKRNQNLAIIEPEFAEIINYKGP